MLVPTVVLVQQFAQQTQLVAKQFLIGRERMFLVTRGILFFALNFFLFFSPFFWGYADSILLPSFLKTPYRQIIEELYQKHAPEVSKQNQLLHLDIAFSFADAYPQKIRYFLIELKPFRINLLLDDEQCFEVAWSKEQLVDSSKKRTPYIYHYPIKRIKPFIYYRGNSSLDFFDAIYGNSDYEIYSKLEKVKVFAKTIQFHRDNNAALQLQKAITRIDSATSDEVIQWKESIKTIQSYQNRLVAGSTHKSMHSYGIAIDFRYKKTKGQEYWLWSSYNKGKWWEIPQEQLHSPPETVISIFEKHGFVWGGNWAMFDTMHFEYRPEIMGRQYRLLNPYKQLN